MKRRCLVVGLGRFGSSLATSLSSQGFDVVGVDSDPDFVDALKERIAYAVEMDCTDPAALAAIDASRCDVAVVAIGTNFEASVLCVAALKELQVPRILARARDARQARILRAVGADLTIEVETEIGRRLATQLATEVVEPD